MPLVIRQFTFLIQNLTFVDLLYMTSCFEINLLHETETINKNVKT